MRFLEAPLRLQPPTLDSERRPARVRSRASRKCVPKQSLGTSGTGEGPNSSGEDWWVPLAAALGRQCRCRLTLDRIVAINAPKTLAGRRLHGPATMAGPRQWHPSQCICQWVPRPRLCVRPSGNSRHRNQRKWAISDLRSHGKSWPSANVVANAFPASVFSDLNSRTVSRLCVGVQIRLTFEDTPTQSRGRGTLCSAGWWLPRFYCSRYRARVPAMRRPRQRRPPFPRSRTMPICTMCNSSTSCTAGPLAITG